MRLKLSSPPRLVEAAAEALERQAPQDLQEPRAQRECKARLARLPALAPLARLAPSEDRQDHRAPQAPLEVAVEELETLGLQDQPALLDLVALAPCLLTPPSAPSLCLMRYLQLMWSR